MFLFKKIFFLTIILSSFLVLSQNETSNWYFGKNAGINFKNTQETVLKNGAMNTPAGCSSISDRNGNLLFYTNGKTVWNKNHEIMKNGTNLAADITNSQTSIIIPKPNDNNTYFIFLTREKKSTNPLLTSGLFYAQVEFSNQNPLGEVTIKSTRLLNTTTERITAIHDAENQSIKVIAFGSEKTDTNSPKDTFFVFNIDKNGLNRTPTTTKEKEIESVAGAMKISPDGTKIAIADAKIIHLYNFNINNSSISFYKSINTNFLRPHGIEFSQDSKILYFTISGSIFKYLIYNDNVLNEKIFIAGTSKYNYGDLQLANNGKIYVANYIPESPITSISSIGVINNPENDFNDNNFLPLAVNLESGASYKGLPNFISSFLRNRIITQNKCIEETFQFDTDSYMPIDSIYWEFGDGSTSKELKPSHQYSYSGKYLVNATITYNNIDYILQKDIEVYEKPLINDGAILTQCDADLDGISLFNLNNIKDKVINYNRDYEYSFYLSYNDAVIDNNKILNSENYINSNLSEELFVKIISPKGCYTINNFFIETTNINLIEIEPIYTCDGTDGILNNNIGSFDLRIKELEIRTQFNIPETSKVSFHATFEDAQTKLNQISSYNTVSTTLLWLRIETQNNNCSAIGYFNAIVNSKIQLDINNSYSICYSNLNSAINLDGNQNNDAWEWKENDGQIISTNQKISLDTPGNYSVTVYKTENNLTCSRTKKFTIKSPNPITFKELKTENNQIFISVIGQSDYEYSLDGINYFGNNKEYTFRNIKAGIYTLYVKDIDNCEKPINKSIAFIGYPKYFTPNNDGINDFWKIEGISKDFYTNGDIYIYDRYGKSLYFMNLTTNLNGWDGTLNGQRLASNDYWFKAILTDNQNNSFTKTGHFAIKY